jgi:NAD(P)-dependent dehydrogenase (short-subunit alcohol dehydrogenase family)
VSRGELTGKTCLITGASRGLGRSVARRFWEAGASLVLTVRDPRSVANLVADLEPAPGQSVVTVPMDLLDLASVKALAARTQAQGVTQIDVLVNNAAVLGPIGKAWDNPALEWESAISANLTAPALICNSLVPLLARASGGSIINLSGGGASGPRKHFSAYAAAKAGLVRFSETLAEEVKELGIRVNCVAPGPMGTDMLAIIEQVGVEVAGEKEYAAAKQALANGERTLQAAVELILFLASSRSQGISGKLISAIWDNWQDFPDHLQELNASDACTLRRIAGRDRGFSWCDK